jgi:N-acylglucosamine 2-epimerase
MDSEKLKKQYHEALVKDVMPFWERYSIDRKNGGYFSCLDRTGKVYDTDKFVWLQGRQVWTFSMLYNHLEKKDSWLKLAGIGAEFLAEHGRDEKGNWYFALDKTGRPITVPYSIFSDCFAAMAFSQYGTAANDAKAKDIGRATFENILRRKKDPAGTYSKAVAGARPLKIFAVPMILVNLAGEMRGVVKDEQIERLIDETVEEVMSVFLDKRRMLVFENVLEGGGHCDCFEGRLINPGHTIEAMWFILDIAEQRNDQRLMDKAVEVILSTLDFGWDKKHGGIFYFLDAEGRPPEQLEWDQKLWWVHAETLVALLMSFRLTGNRQCLQWFKKIHSYTWDRFPDPEHGEWFGYLNRQGKVLIECKGGKWKGCFHVPRALYRCQRELEMLGRGRL